MVSHINAGTLPVMSRTQSVIAGNYLQLVSRSVWVLGKSLHLWWTWIENWIGNYQLIGKRLIKERVAILQFLRCEDRFQPIGGGQKNAE